MLTVTEAAEFLRVPMSWIYEHVRPEAHDRLPFVKLGKYLRFDVRDLQAYIDATKNDLGVTGVGPGCRKPARVEHPQYLRP